MIHLITGKNGTGKTAFSAALISKLLDDEPGKARREQARHDRLGEKVNTLRNKASLYVPENTKGWKLSREADIVEAGITRYVERSVVTDLELRGEFAKRVTTIKSHAELAKIHDCYLFLDEAQLYLNARTWSAVPIEIQFLLQQHRKRNIEIFFIVQNARRMDVICRELVGRYWECERPFRFNPLARLFNFNRLIRITEYDATSVLWTAADDMPDAVKTEKIMKTNWMWLQGPPLEDEILLGGNILGPFGFLNVHSPYAEDAWIAYYTRQEIKIPIDAKYHGSQSAAEIGDRPKGGGKG